MLGRHMLFSGALLTFSHVLVPIEVVDVRFLLDFARSPYNHANLLLHCYPLLGSVRRRSLVSIVLGYLDDYMAERLYGGLP